MPKCRFSTRKQLTHPSKKVALTGKYWGAKWLDLYREDVKNPKVTVLAVESRLFIARVKGRE